MILVDTNVLLDVVEDDPTWADWSQRQLDAASLRGPICINPVIYAELSMAFARIEELEAVVADGGLEVDDGCSAEVAEKRRIEHAANGVVAVLFAEQTRQHPVGVDGEHVLAPLTVHELHPDRQPVGRVDRWCRTGREDQRQH